MSPQDGRGEGHEHREASHQQQPVCYHNRFSGEPCSEPAVWKSDGLFTIVDGWTWCALHAPSRQFRRLIDHGDTP